MLNIIFCLENILWHKRKAGYVEHYIFLGIMLWHKRKAGYVEHYIFLVMLWRKRKAVIMLLVFYFYFLFLSLFCWLAGDRILMVIFIL